MRKKKEAGRRKIFLSRHNQEKKPLLGGEARKL